MVNITRTTTLLFFIRVIGMLVSVVSVTITAHFFGVSVEKDCWILALTLTTTIIQAVWGPLNETYRAKFVFIREREGVEKAVSMTSSLIGCVFVFTILLSVVVVVFSKDISSFMIGNIPTDSYGIVYVLLISLIPTMIITEFSKISTSILNAFDIFYIPEIVGLITSIINIILIIILAPKIGILSLLIATYVSTSLLLVVDIFFLKKKQIHIWGKLVRFDISEVKPFLVFALPFFFPYFVGQLNGLSEKYIAALLGQGAISSLDYSSQFTKILQSVLSSILTTVMVPILAKNYSNGEMSRCAVVLKENTRVCWLILIASCAFLVGGAEPICRFFFFRGKVSVDQLLVIVELTRIYGLMFVNIFMYLLFGYSLLSLGKGKLYASIGVLTQIIVMVLYMLGFWIFRSLYIFPFSAGIAHFFAAGLMIYFARDIISRQLIWFVAKSFLLMVLISTIVYVFNEYQHYDQVVIQILLNGLVVSIILLLSLPMLGYNAKFLWGGFLNKILKRL